MWSLKNKQTNKQKNELIDTENGLVAVRGRGSGMGKMGEGGQNYKFPVINQISHRDVMCSMAAIVNNSYCVFSSC